MKTLWFIPSLLAAGLSITMTFIASAKTPWLMPAEDDPLPAETQQQIRALVNEGVAASAKNDWEGARAALLKAWEMRPLATIAANLGYVELKLEKYREAAEHLQYFLERAPAGRPERRTDAEQQLAECRKHVATVEIKANVDGVQVTLDGLEIGQTPLANQRFLDAGMHTFKVARSGYHPETRAISIEADRDVVVQFKLLAEPVVPTEPSPTAQSASHRPLATERRGTQPRTWVVIGGSVATAIGLGVGIAYRIRASSLTSDANSTLAQLDAVSAPSQVASHGECVTPAGIAQTLCGQLHSDLAKKDTATNTSTAAFITAGALGLATAATYFLWPQKSSNAEQMQQAWQVAPMSLGGIHGVQVVTVF